MMAMCIGNEKFMKEMDGAIKAAIKAEIGAGRAAGMIEGDAENVLSVRVWGREYFFRSASRLTPHCSTERQRPSAGPSITDSPTASPGGRISSARFGITAGPCVSAAWTRPCPGGNTAIDRLHRSSRQRHDSQEPAREAGFPCPPPYHAIGWTSCRSSGSRGKEEPVEGWGGRKG